jgi:ubiquinone/menaquinone biosynthesis C-methylase UbiE
MKKDVREYYKKTGWALNDKGEFVDTLVNENLQNVVGRYNSKTRRRVLLELMNQPGCEYGKILDCASGPVHYPEYIEYSAAYQSRYCVDFSKEALKHAEVNLTQAGQSSCKFIYNDFFEESFPANFFDSAISMHTLYHVDKDRQEDFVRKMIDCVKPEMKVLIVYSNPFSLRSILALPLNLSIKIARFFKRSVFRVKATETFYFERHPLGWWKRFSDIGSVEIKSYRFLTPTVEKMLIPDNKVGKFIFKQIFKFETMPISKYFSDFYMVVIKKDQNLLP